VRRVSQLLGLMAAIALGGGNGCSSTSDRAASRETGNAAKAGLREPGAATFPEITNRKADVRPVSGLGSRLDRSRDAYVLLSGGGTPLTNNYSQYLQARAIAAFFERECPPDRTWVFFGAGNRAGETPLLSDARRERKQDGFLVQSWLPGTLARNRPATRESFLQALKNEILPLVRDGGTLYLFIGDHGELAGAKDQQESAITMWQLKRSRRRSGGWVTDDKEILGVAELRDVLAAGLGEGRVVFGMTQCHGGGFHELGVAREMVPPRSWFVGAPPVWAAGNPAGLRLRVAGFTATDEASPAAGCDADPDPDRWAGYERFLPESLLGIDLMSGAAKGRPAASLAAAHDAATIVDHTIDKPRATSDHYLEAWARLIETRLKGELRLSPATRNAMETYERAVDRGQIAANHDALRARQEQFARFTQRLVEQAPAAKALLLGGNRRQLHAAINSQGERGGRSNRGSRRAALGEVRKSWSETLRPAWKAAVEAGTAAGLAGAVLTFEKRLLEIEDGGRDLLLPRGGTSNSLLDEIYRAAGYGEPASLDAGNAEAIARWGAERRARIVAWAKSSPRPDLRAAAEKIGPGPTWVDEAPRPLSQKTAAERVLYYRRVLAAWEFLLTMHAGTALSELETLIELERLPVRPETG
jgi:hypothetical protein